MMQPIDTQNDVSRFRCRRDALSEKWRLKRILIGDRSENIGTPEPHLCRLYDAATMTGVVVNYCKLFKGLQYNNGLQ